MRGDDNIVANTYNWAANLWREREVHEGALRDILEQFPHGRQGVHAVGWGVVRGMVQELSKASQREAKAR